MSDVLIGEMSIDCIVGVIGRVGGIISIIIIRVAGVVVVIIVAACCLTKGHEE